MLLLLLPPLRRQRTQARLSTMFGANPTIQMLLLDVVMLMTIIPCAYDQRRNRGSTAAYCRATQGLAQPLGAGKHIRHGMLGQSKTGEKVEPQEYPYVRWSSLRRSLSSASSFATCASKRAAFTSANFNASDLLYSSLQSSSFSSLTLC